MRDNLPPILQPPILMITLEKRLMKSGPLLMKRSRKRHFKISQLWKRLWLPLCHSKQPLEQGSMNQCYLSGSPYMEKVEVQVNVSESAINIVFSISQTKPYEKNPPSFVYHECLLSWSQGRRSEEWAEMSVSSFIFACYIHIYLFLA